MNDQQATRRSRVQTAGACLCAIAGLSLTTSAASAQPPSPADVNGDGTVDVHDYNLLLSAVFGGSSDLLYDMNFDGTVNQLDVQPWRDEASATNFISGGNYAEPDANLDGVVDGKDFILWNAHKFTNRPNRHVSKGDFNRDGFSDGVDFVVWNSQKFTEQGVTTVDSRTSIHDLATVTSAVGGVAGDGVPDLVYDNNTGIMSIDLDGATTTVAVVVEGQDGSNAGMDWVDGAAVGSTNFPGFLQLTQGYAGGAEHYVVTSTLTGIEFANSLFTMSDYGTGLTMNDFGEVLIALDDGTIYSTNVVPAPGAVTLIALGGLIATRRRR